MTAFEVRRVRADKSRQFLKRFDTRQGAESAAAEWKRTTSQWVSAGHGFFTPDDFIFEVVEVDHESRTDCEDRT